MARPRRPSRPKPFVPYRPPSPPAGSYDPALDAQRLAAARGLADLTQDVETQGTRGIVDYGLGREQLLRQAGNTQQDLGQQRQYGLEDLGTSRDRSLADLGTGAKRGMMDLSIARTQAGNDYQRNVGMLQRSYHQLAQSQQEQQNAAGVLRGGAALQAARKRAENEQIDRQPLDEGLRRTFDAQTLAADRLGEDYQTGEARTNQDYAAQRDRLQSGYETQTGRLGDESQWQLGQMGLGLQRSSQDQSLQLQRARRENAAFGLDIGVQQAYQAAGSGWVPPQRPKNESTFNGQPVRTIRQGNQLVDYDQTGRVVRRRRA